MTLCWWKGWLKANSQKPKSDTNSDIFHFHSMIIQCQSGPRTSLTILNSDCPHFFYRISSALITFELVTHLADVWPLGQILLCTFVRNDTLYHNCHCLLIIAHFHYWISLGSVHLLSKQHYWLHLGKSFVDMQGNETSIIAVHID